MFNSYKPRSSIYILLLYSSFIHMVVHYSVQEVLDYCFQALQRIRAKCAHTALTTELFRPVLCTCNTCIIARCSLRDSPVVLCNTTEFRGTRNGAAAGVF